MFRPMKLSNRYLPWMTVTYDGLGGGFGLLGDSLSGGTSWRDGFGDGLGPINPLKTTLGNTPVIATGRQTETFKNTTAHVSNRLTDW